MKSFIRGPDETTTTCTLAARIQNAILLLFYYKQVLKYVI